MPVDVFFSYSHKDETLRDELEKHLSTLKRSEIIKTWHDRRIGAGQERDDNINDALENADIILLLISADFLASDYCHEIEMKRAIERHNAKEARVIPVILHACDWINSSFGKLIAIPKDGKPISKWDDQNEALLDVTNEIRLAAIEIDTDEKRAEKQHAPPQDVFLTLRNSVIKAIEIAELACDDGRFVRNVETGFRDIDQILGGLHQSDLILLAGRPSMGKTSLALNISFHAAKQSIENRGTKGAITGYFSLEMSADQLATRVLASQSGISFEKIRKGHIEEEDFKHFVNASQKLASIPLYIDDTAALSITELKERARWSKKRYGMEFLVVDYLQLLRNEKKKENRKSELARFVKGLKNLAIELNIPILLLSQLPRAIEEREHKWPQIVDLHEYGDLISILHQL